MKKERSGRRKGKGKGNGIKIEEVITTQIEKYVLLAEFMRNKKAPSDSYNIKSPIAKTVPRPQCYLTNRCNAHNITKMA